MIPALLIVNSLYIDIKGEVVNPGVYKTDKILIDEAINLAGGLTNYGDTNNINLSNFIEDEMVLYIPSRKEKKKCICACPIIKYNKDQKCIKNQLDESNKLIDKKTENISKEEDNEQNELEDSSLININTSKKERLVLLNGIGEKTAINIIDYRKEKPFVTKEDLLNVKGIGPKLFASIKSNITV